MTPNDIVMMGVLNGLNIMALTDHNSSKNCPAFVKAAKKQGIIPVCGMELTTAEDIHVVCLFPELERAMAFDELVDSRRIKIKNKPSIFGEQLILDENDEIVGSEEHLLINATQITVEEAPQLVKEYGGLCYPAHVDRETNGIIATLGDFPADSGFGVAEFADSENIASYVERYGALNGLKIVVSSDAHYLWNIKEKQECFELEDEPYSSSLVVRKMLEHLGCEV